MPPKPTTVVPFESLDVLSDGGPNTDVGASPPGSAHYRPTEFEDDSDNDAEDGAAFTSHSDASRGGGRRPYFSDAAPEVDDSSNGGGAPPPQQPARPPFARKGSCRRTAPSSLSPIAGSPMDGKLMTKRVVNIPMMRLDSLEDNPKGSSTASGGAGGDGAHEESQEALSSDGSRGDGSCSRSEASAVTPAAAATQQGAPPPGSSRRKRGASLDGAGAGDGAEGALAASTRALLALSPDSRKRELTACANSVRDEPSLTILDAPVPRGGYS